jgi:hypothetical protein
VQRWHLFCVLVLTYGVMMSRLMVVMRGSVMVSGRLMVMLTRRMLWCLCHFIALSLGVNRNRGRQDPAVRSRAIRGPSRH